MHSTYIWRILATAIAILGVCDAVSAGVIGLGGSATLPGDGVVPSGPGVSVLSDTTESFAGKDSQGGTVFTGNVESWVYKVAGGDLDFVYQVSNNSSFPNADSITAMSVASFDHFTTDVDYVPNTGSVAPYDATRDLTGAVVGFDIYSGIAPTQNTDLLVIDTDATTFSMNGNAAVSDGGTGDAAVNVPLASVSQESLPEPASLAILGVSVCGLTMTRPTRKMQG